VKYEINELFLSARHAYISIGLAVKTSRPQYFNDRHSGEAPAPIPARKHLLVRAGPMRAAKLTKTCEPLQNLLHLRQDLYQINTYEIRNH